MRLKGKTALITGGGEGIGKATALLFCKEGAKVGITGRTKEKLDQVIKEAKGSGEIIALPGDVSREVDVKKTVQDFVKKFKKIDILFNNAGVLESGTVTTTTLESWDKTIDINVKGLFLMCKYVVPLMIKNGGGSIINNSSVAGFIGCPNTVAYCTSKGAVMQFTRSLALDHVNEGIRVNTICPGFIKTKMNEDFIGNPPDAQKQLDVMAAQIVPMGKRGEPIDIAYGVLYLASDESRYVTGSSLVIDGGWTTY
ncbi:MAG: glucose 1-dehydrogenase [Candidatus Dadabacteria bacterium CSP1-2]|jgi:NAD(P)-dependent dehydrogenase (short-subunit alcohol dehydrogenase family)|nr:MAG: glucose 1-dehydrogenase [Candidatus Dadabacteria bacterium CSP1-2]